MLCSVSEQAMADNADRNVKYCQMYDGLYTQSAVTPRCTKIRLPKPKPCY